ncbi:MAG: MMPL family transporter [Microthrixaceae bacterium]
MTTTPTPTPTRPPLLGRLGRWVARHHRLVLAIWLVVLVGSGFIGGVYKKSVSDNFRIPHSDSQAAYDLLGDRFGSQNSATATVVFSGKDGASLSDGPGATAMSSAVSELEKVRGVHSVSEPGSPSASEALEQVAGSLPPDEASALEELAQRIPGSVSSDGTIAYTTVTFDETLLDLEDRYPVSADKAASDYTNPYSELDRALSGAREAGIVAVIGGPVADTWNNPTSWLANHADEIGLLIGALLLLLAFGSLWGMAIPISTALFGAVTASGLVYLLSNFITVSSAAPPVTLMISLGVGLDYSLLIVTRYRQFIGEGRDPVESVGLAVRTAGKAAVFAGLTVCVALLGLLLVPIPLVQTLGLAAAVGVGVMIISAMTLLPALLGFAGRKIDALGLPNRRHEEVDPTTSFWGRFATATARRPVVSLAAGIVALVLLAAPFLSIHFGMPDDGSLPKGLSQRQAYDLMDQGFGSGVNSPLVVAVGLPKAMAYADALTTLEPVSTALGAEQAPGTVEGVEFSVGPIPNSADAATAVIYQITPTTGPDAAATSELVHRLRTSLDAATKGTDLEAHVGGSTATLIDLTSLVTKYLPFVIGAVVIGAFILLMLVFRSVLVPLKAAIMNLLSISAAYGVVVAVFQWGWARQLVGISETIPIVSFVPLVMFVILFGLSMDYEVFLMSRIKEEWDRTGDAKRSVVLGVANTARVITTAAAIMMAVFLAFVANPSPTVKLIGFGMAIAVLIDSTVVRMVLVPAVMDLFGPRAWWFPKWLGWLPHLDIEGVAPPVATSDAPEPDRDSTLVGS